MTKISSERLEKLRPIYKEAYGKEFTMGEVSEMEAPRTQRSLLRQNLWLKRLTKRPDIKILVIYYCYLLFNYFENYPTLNHTLHTFVFILYSYTSTLRA